jgi:hypothetical protein
MDTITIKTDSTIVAVFLADNHNLEIRTNPEIGGTVERTTNTDCEELLEAIPNRCYTFVNWTDTFGNILPLRDIPADSLLTVVLSSDSVVIANFALDMFDLALTVTPTGAGEITGAGNYPCDEEVPYTATANHCYKFVRWENAATGATITTDASYQIVMDKDYTLRAVFQQDSFNLTTYPEPFEGGITIGNGRFECDKKVIYQATPNDCYTFVNWTDSLTGAIISTSRIDSIIMDRDYTLIANFLLDSFNLALTVNPAGSGTVEGAGRYGCNTSATYKAISNECYTFVNWTDTETGDVISSNMIDAIIMTRDRALTANFVMDSLNLTTIADPPEGGTTFGDGKYACHDIAEYRAVPNDCYTFINWTDAVTGDTVSLNTVNNITMIRDYILIAHFVRDTFDLTLTVNPAEAGTVTGAGRYPCNEQVTYSAEPNECYRFVNWTDATSGAVVSTNPSNPLTMRADRDLIANFELFNYSFNLATSFLYSNAYTLGDAPLKLQFRLNTDANAAELNKVTEINVNFDYCTVFARVKPNVLDLPQNWRQASGTGVNTPVDAVTSNYSVKLLNSNPGGNSGLSNNLDLFKVEFEMALPNSEMIVKPEQSHYTLSVSPILDIITANCLTPGTDVSRININPFCAIDYRVLNLSDKNFGLIVQDNEINYSIAFDCDASLTIYNSIGQAVLIPASGVLSKGVYTIDMNDTDLHSGNYYCELKINNLYRKVVGLYIAK